MFGPDLGPDFKEPRILVSSVHKRKPCHQSATARKLQFHDKVPLALLSERWMWRSSMNRMTMKPGETHDWRRPNPLSELDLRLILELGRISENSGAPVIPSRANTERARHLARLGLLREHAGFDEQHRPCHSYSVTEHGLEAFSRAQRRAPVREPAYFGRMVAAC